MAAIQGVIGSVTSGTSILNSFLVALQKVNFDVKAQDEVAFLFAYRETDTVDLRSDITDHYTENNSAVQDQIALKPEEVTLHGFIGELTTTQDGITEKINNIASQLSVLSPYVPTLTVAALEAYNQAKQIYDTASSAAQTITQAYDMIVSNDLQNKQQKAYAYFYKKWQERALFTVQTPWSIFENMAILSLKATQEAESNMVSDFQITFKKMRFASTVTVNKIPQGRLLAQRSSQLNQGTQNPLSLGAYDPSSTGNIFGVGQ